MVAARRFVSAAPSQSPLDPMGSGSGSDAAGSAQAQILSEPSQGCSVASAPRSRLETFWSCASQAFSILDYESVCYLR